MKQINLIVCQHHPFAALVWHPLDPLSWDQLLNFGPEKLGPQMMRDLIAKQEGPAHWITYSEGHVLALMKAVRKGLLTPSQVTVYFDVPDQPGKLVEIAVTPDGDFAEYVPGGFFAWRMDELFD